MNTPTGGLPTWYPEQQVINSGEQNRLVSLVRELANKNPPRAPNLAPGPRGGGDGIHYFKVIARTTEFTVVQRDPDDPINGTIGAPFVVKAFSKRRADEMIGMIDLAMCEPDYPVGTDLPVWDEEKKWFNGVEMITARQAFGVFTEAC